MIPIYIYKNALSKEKKQSETVETHNKQNISISKPMTQEDKSNSLKYNLCGYLSKYHSKTIGLVRGLTGTSPRKRWFIYADQTCKLYYYKSDKDPEPLGEIDIALASFSYDADSSSSGLFTISCGGKDYLLEASSSKERIYWLQSLQNARREFNERLSFSKYKSTDTCITRPESGLLKDIEPLPPLAPDPHSDLMVYLNKTVNSTSTSQSLDPIIDKASKTNLNLPLKIFRTSTYTNMEHSNVTSHVPNHDVTHSPIISPVEPNNFDKISQKFRTSFKIRRPKFIKSNSEEFFEPQKEKLQCKGCLQSQEDLEIMMEECSRQKDCCDAFKEAVQILQKELEALQREKFTLEKLDNILVTDEDILAIFRDKDRKIVELEHYKHQLTNSLATLTTNLRDGRTRNEHLEEKLSMMTSLIEAKDNAIMDLSRQLEYSRSLASHSEEERDYTSSFYSKSVIPPVNQHSTSSYISIGTQTSYSDMENLKDMLEGYKCQNSFLNKEILELNTILKHRSEREQKLITESSNWEAKFYQIQSKYLLLLNDLHSPQASQHDSKVLSQLLQDVVNAQGTTDLRVTRKQGKGYDEYGFCITAPSETDILSKAEFLQKQSKTFASQAEYQKTVTTTTTWESRWESLLAGTNSKELPQQPELKYLIREGIPYQYKGKVWRLLIESHIGKYKSTLSPTYYQDLLSTRSSTSTLDPSAKQIELDLLRTLPNNRHYESPFADGVPKLRRVLLAFSRHNLAVGYCQGLNRLAAIALLFLNEEDAFWCLVYIIDYLMPPDFYTGNLLGSQIDQRVLKDLINEKLPRLSCHFEQHGLDISLFTFNWFLCIYIDAIPPSTYLYIWDSFLYEGTKVLFRFSIGIFKLCEESILSKKDYMAIFDYLRSVPEPIADVHKLKQFAFQWANPLSMRHIRNRRDFHRAIVKAELDEVEEVRKSYKMSRKMNAKEKEEEDETDNEEEKEVEQREKGASLDDKCTEMKTKFSEIKQRGKQLLRNRLDLEWEKGEKKSEAEIGCVKWVKIGTGVDDDEEITIEHDAEEEIGSASANRSDAPKYKVNDDDKS